jgi:amino acid transporter
VNPDTAADSPGPGPPAAPAAALSVRAVTALAVGGMMGAGLYTLLGLAASTSGGMLPLAFLLAGVVAGFSVYSYAKLGATFPSRGGAAEYLRESFGEGLVAGGLNVFQYAAYIIATALYAAGFAEYVAALAGDEGGALRKLVGVGVVVVFTGVNLLSSKLVGRSETVIVAIEMLVLVGFVAFSVPHLEPDRLRQAAPDGALGVLSAAALLYVTYQGFGVAATAGGSMGNPKRDLPRALYVALAIVGAVYLIVSSVVVMLLDLSAHTDSIGHLLADAGQAIAGRTGFVVISAAALLATASAVNATLFASANIGYDVAGHREIAQPLTRTVGRAGNVALLLAAACVIALVVFFPLTAVGQMTSLAFLVVYGAVSLGHLRLRARTGARRGLLLAAIVANTVLFVLLLVQAVRTGPASTWITLLVVLAGSFGYEWVRRRGITPGGPGGSAA